MGGGSEEKREKKKEVIKTELDLIVDAVKFSSKPEGFVFKATCSVALNDFQLSLKEEH